MKVQHLLIRHRPGSMDADVFCGRAVGADGIFADRRDDHGYSADGVTCKWCLKRLGVRSVPTGQVSRTQYDKVVAERDALADSIAEDYTLTRVRRERDVAVARCVQAERLLGEAAVLSHEALDINHGAQARDFAERIVVFYGDDIPSEVRDTLSPFLAAKE